ncbi:hypothetical protein [uncultured Oscillibacter sp.]|uniref:hypothetical protein n=1 Tax=uncultured Oscillibacter sp. TaxID=876091 RepID=UPI0025FB720C|nr:hypothetical protein [uncultured Oscillibacter sp.]
MKIKDLLDIIADNAEVGLAFEGNNDIPITDIWSNWKRDFTKEGLERDINKIYDAAYILLELKSK